MTIDLSLVVTEAFTILKEEATEVSNISLKIKNEKVRVEELTRMLLQHLIEIDLIDVHMDKLAQISYRQAGRYADHATVLLPQNQLARLAMELDSLSQEEIIEMAGYLKRPFHRSQRRSLPNPPSFLAVLRE